MALQLQEQAWLHSKLAISTNYQHYKSNVTDATKYKDKIRDKYQIKSVYRQRHG